MKIEEYEESKELSEAVLRRLLVGASVSGMRFFTPQVLFDGPSGIGGESYINLTSNWTVIPSGATGFTRDLREVDQKEEETVIHTLRGAKVVDVVVESPEPNLRVIFEDGRSILMDGHDESYEPWQAGLNHPDPDQCWLVVACPGDRLAVWCPDEFSEQVGVGNCDKRRA